jgi:hypothetical protein
LIELNVRIVTIKGVLIVGENVPTTSGEKEQIE